MTWVFIWLAVLVASVIFEIVTYEMVSIWVAVGAFVSLILAACGVRYEVQIVVAVVVALICILALRKVTLKWLTKNKADTNLDRVIGQVEKLTKAITEDQPGLIKINGVEWSAVSKDGKPIENDTKVEVVKVDGNKFIVKKVDE